MATHNEDGGSAKLEFSSLLRIIPTSMEHATKGLYDLQTAAINANGESPPRDSETFKRIRAPLKEQWEAIAQLFRKCISLGNDIKLLQKYGTGAEKDEIVVILGDISTKGQQCAGLALQLANGHDAVVEPYFSQREAFQKQLDHPKVKVDVRQSQPTTPQPASAGRSSKVTATRRASQEEFTIDPLEAFLAESGKSLYPDGLRAMALVQNSFDSIQDHLFTLSNLLHQQSETYDRFLTKAKSTLDEPTMKEAQDMAQKWEMYRKDLTEVVNDVFKICDAIMVDATGAPPPVNATQMIGHEDSANEYPKGGVRDHPRGIFSRLLKLFAKRDTSNDAR
ncbi:SubName: Full=Uncharacterized protein {ECO:0000313/EMBL:CCA73653.1} [Serendipita indica DSM 11827]|uniref:Uncharacterized protein n=1 Tax=Serendipita indica (strain DSM 11827) TaxID=1109443 RepID=G4TQR0_SERID|nr:SubName: Full=Uncharacterized protein {ECO:0000313/EMBL:CCA73653.1} [Serendipita indica DSM 11827]CCA73653.1 hypothetical protein PIIN_07606 [Serendipita indica DSM 11827]